MTVMKGWSKDRKHTKTMTRGLFHKFLILISLPLLTSELQSTEISASSLRGTEQSNYIEQWEMFTSNDMISSHQTMVDIDTLGTTLSFLNDSLCYIIDPRRSMTVVAQELTALLEGKDTVVNIVHLGDSHIQAGFLSGRTMRLMQGAFGNAGRGWVAPFKLSRVNEPNDYYIQSNIKQWIAGRCVQSSPKCPWGIGGIGIKTEAKTVRFDLVIAPNNGAGYSFNKVLMYRDSLASPMLPLKDEPMAGLSFGKQAYERVVIDTFEIKSLIDTFAIKSVATQNATNLYYGFMLTNGNPGVLYHSIGVNGARYTDFTNRKYIRQLSLLKPSLLIVSLGTNESFGRNFSEEEFAAQIRAFVNLVREEMPDVTLLLTTPIESYRRYYKNKKRYYRPNENMPRVAASIRSLTADEGLACLDLYSVGGGQESCAKWFESGMLGSDRVHFSRSGYTEQGALLFKALMRSCLNERDNYSGEELGSAEFNYVRIGEEVSCVE
jgi:lysophospholipase L1-like esterase